MQENDLLQRLLNFSIRTIKYSRTLPYDIEFKNIRHQLSKSCSSPGANYEEAQGASSKADFHNKIKISLKEMRESNYWFKVIKGVLDENKSNDELEYLIQESSELKRILGSIASKTRKD